MPVRAIAERVGLTPTPCWRRIQNLEEAGVIRSRVALLDPAAIGLGVTAIVQVRTASHNAEWLERFLAAVGELPEITEAYRTSGDTDYVLKVVAADIEGFDSFYKRLIELVDLFDVRSTFVMETLKSTTALPLDRAGSVNA